MLTMQRIEAESKEGRKFLRRVIRDKERLGYSETWSARASAETDWCVRFERVVRGEVGESDERIEVQTDIEVFKNTRTGMVKAFSDAKEVHLPNISRVWVTDSAAAIVAKAMLDGCRLRVEASAGSTNSSQLGLGFYSLSMDVKGIDFASVTIGCETITKDGRPIIRGAVDVD